MLDDYPYLKTFLKGLAFTLGAIALVAALASGFGALGIGAFGATAAISSAASAIGVPSALSAIGSVIGVSSLSTAATLGISGAVAGIGIGTMYTAGPDLGIAQSISNKMARDSGDQQYKQDRQATKEAVNQAKAEAKKAEKQAKLETKEAKNQYQKDYKARHDILDKGGRTDKLTAAIKNGDPIKIKGQIGKLTAAVKGIHLKDLDKIDPKQAGKSVAAVTKALAAVEKALKSDPAPGEATKKELNALKKDIETKLNNAAKDIAKCDDKTKEKLQQSVRSIGSEAGNIRWSNLSEFNEKIKTDTNRQEDIEKKKEELDTKRSEFASKLSHGSDLIQHFGNPQNMVSSYASDDNFPEQQADIEEKLMQQFTKQVRIYENKGISHENAVALTATNIQDLVFGEQGSDQKENIQNFITPKQSKPAKPQQSMEAAADILAGIDLKGVSSGNASRATAPTAQAQGHGQGNQGREV